MVYSAPVARTNIEIDDELIEQAMRRLRVRTKREAVELALRQVVGQPLTIEEALAMQGARLIDEIPEDAGP